MLLLISGPSGAGKSTVVARLLAEDPRLCFSVSTTTRPPRAAEVDGREYHFVDDARFDALIAAGAFVEWARVHDHRYGTRIDHLREMEAAGRLPLLDIDVQGGVEVIERYGAEVVSVFLFPPSWDELERRLRGRETDSEPVIATRLGNARREVGYADRYAYWVVNDAVEAAVARLQAILVAEGCRRERAARPPMVAEKG
jgi:guanylate kinase